MGNVLMLVCLVMVSLPAFIGGCASSSSPGTLSSSSQSTQTSGAPDFVALAQKLKPVVVNVSATIAPRPQKQQPPASPEGSPDEGLNPFSGEPAPSPAIRQKTLGSGVIIGANGTILTDAHVIDHADRILVRLADKREFPAEIVGADLTSDIAIIKINTKEPLQTAQFGDSDGLQVGEWVMAVGNPFGLDNTVTSGIISATGRHIGAGPFNNFIQTNATINPGNSGGPLVNRHGEVVGINLALVSQGGGNSGIAFATPISLVKELLPELQRTGKVTRSSAGLAVQEITPDLADALGLESAEGALVAGLAKDGPAERAGIQLGDVITEYDGKPIRESNDLPSMIARTPVDKTVQVTLLRNKQPLRLAVVVEESRESAGQGGRRKSG
jgi:serine protease Do